ncbi:hypothetical protein OO013_19415 [Mangrovivirga sp. M17]|uniref:DUF3221 domain-containing protein n=1 Tax=Mangrovivirga halotolerans TaxID=2993936 RepID=A0ABT3RWN2_9BACT|nr:hypothetical protein [Mangrovivirga halotolerans]MCX2746058.1 hypothetical protein [Mangrovivirga halotolerans]
MNKQLLKITALTFSLLFVLVSCGGSHSDVVESGTYSGTIEKVNPDEVEIYVKTDDNKTLELYFTDDTQLMKGGESVDFSVLSEGTNVTVDVEKQGQKVVPLSVTITE